MKPLKINMIALHVLAAVIAVSCGQSSEHSTTSAITPPDRREVSSVESFWLYENKSIADQNWIPLQDSSTKYFPELMPSNGADFFWVAENTTASNVPDRFERHVEGNIPRIEFKTTDSYSNLIFHHSLFEDMDILRTDYSLSPTFELKGRVGDQLAVEFIVNRVCYKMHDSQPEFALIVSKPKVTSKTFTITRPLFETETYVIESAYTAADDISLKAECAKSGATEIASSLEINMKPINVTSPIIVDFPGIFVKRSTRN